MPQKLLQDFLFQQIKEKLAPQITLVDAVAASLYISIDSAYRRIRGETPLILEEVQQLCKEYKISLDRLLNVEGNATIFQVVQVDNKDYSFERYLTGLLQGLRQLQSYKSKEIFYLTKDLAIFHLFCYRPVFAFRYFFWMKSILQHPDFTNRSFNMDCLPPKIEDMGKSLLRIYNEIPSVEIWNNECINSTMAQIEYYREAGFFKNPDDIKIIYEGVKDTIEHIKNQAEIGCKYLPEEKPDLKKENFCFYQNRVVLSDNTILVLHDGAKTLYLNYDVLNYMVTRDEKLCEDVHLKMQNLMRRATILSTVSEKQRNIFFYTLLKKIPNYSKTLQQ
ncbi:MAG: hypothetical protein ABIN57_11825 [Chitinophagaceae bacterium]